MIISQLYIISKTTEFLGFSKLYSSGAKFPIDSPLWSCYVFKGSAQTNRFGPGKLQRETNHGDKQLWELSVSGKV